MDQRQHLRDEIDATVVELTQKVQALEHRASDAKERISNALSLQHHVEERPWTVFGVSVAAGMAIGWLIR